MQDRQLEKVKATSNELQTEHTEKQIQINKLLFEFKYLEEQSGVLKRQSAEKTQELEGLYNELDECKGKLANIYMKYDFNMFDKVSFAIDQLDDYSQSLQRFLEELWRGVETFFECQQCF